MIEEKARISELNGNNPTKSYFMLKNGCFLMIHLIISVWFQVKWLESETHQDVRSPVQLYINTEDFDTGIKLQDIQSVYIAPIDRLSSYDLKSIGSNQAIGDNFRITYRLYETEDNLEKNTNKEFPNVKQSRFGLFSAAQAEQTLFRTVTQYFLALVGRPEVELKEEFIFSGIKTEFKGPSNAYDTFYGEGGYVFNFDKDYMYKVKEENDDSIQAMSMRDFLFDTVPQDFNNQLAILSLDWAMYNVHYDYLIYSAILLNYQPNGEMRISTKVSSFRKTPSMIQLITLFIFFVFYCYFTQKLVRDLWAFFILRDDDNKNLLLPNSMANRANDEEKPWWRRLINFIGIDEKKLEGANFLVVIVLVIAMVVMKIVKTTFYMIRAIWRFCAADMFNLVELLNCIFNTGLLLILIRFLPAVYGNDLALDNPDLLNNTNYIAFIMEDFYFYQAMSVFCLSIRVLKLPSFSLIANLPFETLSQGRKDVMNILIILFIFTLANSLSAYIVFCSQIEDFANLTISFYTVLKIYLGDFSVVSKMYAVASGFTTFFLVMCMSLYSIFMTPMFLGIIVGHFEIEWARVKSIQQQQNQSFKIHDVIWRILTGYFGQRLEEQVRKNERENPSKQAEKKRRCSCPCTWRSLRPSGIIERFVLWCMMNCDRCRKKKDDDKESGAKHKQLDSLALRKSLTTIGNLGFNLGQTSISNLNSQVVSKAAQIVKDLPFNRKNQEWGAPSQLKGSEDFTENNSVKTYMNWYDGWSTEQYKRDFDIWEYNEGKNQSKNQKNALPNEEFKKTQIKDEDLKIMCSKLPSSLEGILNLEHNWNEDVDECEKANSNYWMYHLQKQVVMLSKKELSLYNFKSMDCFFQQKLINRGELSGQVDLLAQLSEKQQEVLSSSPEDIAKYFKSTQNSTEDKYLAWKAIDMVYRYSEQKKAFRTASKEKKKQKVHNENAGDDENKKVKPTHDDLMTLLIAQIERPISQEMEEQIHEYCVTTKIAQPNNGRNPLKFNAIKASAWRDRKYHRVFPVLQKMWRECLTEEEKFDFWFNYFNTSERVRLWNQLVFSREWFRRIVQFSRKQANYLKAVADLDKQQKEDARKAAQKAQKEAKKKEEKDEEGSDNGDNERKPNENEERNKNYKGFHRKDLNEMLKQYAQQMYARDIRNEELLIIKIKPDLKQEITKREHIGTTTSFFNQESDAKAKNKRLLVEKVAQLSEDQELQIAREIFTPDEMLQMWNQFFIGTYMQLPKKFYKPDGEAEHQNYGDDEDQNLDAAEGYKILNVEDEEKYDKVKHNFNDNGDDEAFKNYWINYKRHESPRTMDRYEQIHHFFTIIIDHNVKTLKSCEAIKKENNNTSADTKDDQTDYKSKAAAASDGNKKSALKNKSAVNDEFHDDKGNNENKRDEPIQQKSKYELYKDVRDLVIEEEERLALWMLMSKEQKLDMLAHQCIDAEAQIMGLLIEFEYGAENRFQQEGDNLHLDTLLENSLNQMIFQKYLAYTRLQASFYAKKFTKELIDKTQEQSIKLYNYVEYLYEMNNQLKKKEAKNKKDIDQKLRKNSEIEGALRFRAEQNMQNFKAEQDQSKKTQTALALKFYYEVKPKENEGIDNNQESKKNR